MGGEAGEPERAQSNVQCTRCASDERESAVYLWTSEGRQSQPHASDLLKPVTRTVPPEPCADRGGDPGVSAPLMTRWSSGEPVARSNS